MKEKSYNQKTIKRLIEERSYFIDVKAKISRLLGPKIFELQKENLNNTRNVIIVSGALVTFGLILLDNPIVQNLNIDLLKISIVGFLLTIIFSSFQLNRELSTGINSYYDKFKENVVTAEKGEKIINDCLDNKITVEEVKTKLIPIYEEIEHERIRPQKNKERDKKTYIYDLINYLFIISIAVMVLYVVILLF